MDIYREQLLDHYKHPRGWGLAASFNAQKHLENDQCGDAITVQVDIEGEMVTTMRFEGHGCVISRAAASLLTQYVQKRSMSECLNVDLPTMEELLGVQLPPNRISCALLSLKALHQALQETYATNH